MTSKQLFLEAVLGSFFGTSALNCDICMNGCVNAFENTNGTPAIVGAVKLSGLGVNNRSAFRRMLHGQSLHRTSAVKLVDIGSVKVADYF